jgi:hypothetical protein
MHENERSSIVDTSTIDSDSLSLCRIPKSRPELCSSPTGSGPRTRCTPTGTRRHAGARGRASAWRKRPGWTSRGFRTLNVRLADEALLQVAPGADEAGESARKVRKVGSGEVLAFDLSSKSGIGEEVWVSREPERRMESAVRLTRWGQRGTIGIE